MRLPEARVIARSTDAPPDEAGGDPNFMTSLARGLSVIRAFSGADPQLTIAEVARISGLPRAAARRCLHTLERLGYVGSDGRRFSLRPRILSLGYAFMSSTPLATTLQPVLERVSENVHESCSAAALDEDEIVYIARAATRRIMSVTLNVGSRLPAYCTSMGRTLLAELDEAEIDRLLREHPPLRRTERTITDVARLKIELAHARQQGWCLVNQELEEGLVSLSAPIRDRAGRAIAAMNISGQVNRTSPAYMLEHFLPKLRAAAAEISQMLQRKS